MPGFEVFGEEEKREALDVFDTGVLFRYEFGPQRAMSGRSASSKRPLPGIPVQDSARPSLQGQLP